MYVKFQKLKKLFYGLGSQISGYPLQDDNRKGM